jgi:UDPglucose 6-dehydrogenase
MRMPVIGGYVGSVTGGCLASIGHDVVCNDSDEARSIYSGKGGDCQSSNQGSIRLWRRRCAKGALHSRAM